MAQMSGATLHVVHVVRPVSAAMAGTEHVDATAIAKALTSMRDDADKLCARACEEAERQGVATEAHTVEGDPADVLITVAETVKADLVVIGNRGMSGIKRFVLGRVPNKVSHRCPCSLLIVNTDET